MKFSFGNSIIFEVITIFFLSIVVIIGTFPPNEWVVTPGIDPSLSWAYNYMFENGFQMGKHIIFPHGPLAFFMYPLEENIIISTLVTSLLKFLLVFNIYRLVDKNQFLKIIIAFLVTYLFCLFSGFNQLILINILLLFVNYYKHNRFYYKLLAFTLVAFAFYVKSYVAIMSGVICFSFLMFMVISTKNYKKTGIDVLSIIGIILLFWLTMYGTFSGFINYVIGMVNLAGDNSSAASYYPYNNWWLLSLFLLTIIAIPIINKSKASLFYSVLIGLSLFAAWKHGMAREDIFHVNGLWVYLLIVLVVFLLFIKEKVLINLCLSALAILFFTNNVQNAVGYSSTEISFFRGNNFIDFVSDYSSIKSQSITRSKQSTSNNKLSQSLRESIGNETVDVYPWDYSIIYANNLNWQPRVVIQSYAAYTPWLDKQNADHFNSSKAPMFIIWEIDKISKDLNGGSFNSIDNRYLLNDEPQAMLEILKNYKHYASEGKFLVLKKQEAINHKISLIEKESLSLNEWIKVPSFSKSLIRVKTTFERTFTQTLKSFLYKDEQYWIYLKMGNGLIYKHRVVPKNAKNGIWINPYLYDVNQKHEVKEIMFKASNNKILSEHIELEWEEIAFGNDLEYVLKFFNKGKKWKEDHIMFSSINSFELPGELCWKQLKENQLSDIGYKSKSSHIIKANESSTFFKYELDSLPVGKIKIIADCWLKAPKYKYLGHISMNVSVLGDEGALLWKANVCGSQIIDQTQWNNIISISDYQNNVPNSKLMVSIVNSSETDLFIDDARVFILNEGDAPP